MMSFYTSQQPANSKSTTQFDTNGNIIQQINFDPRNGIVSLSGNCRNSRKRSLDDDEDEYFPPQLQRQQQQIMNNQYLLNMGEQVLLAKKCNIMGINPNGNYTAGTSINNFSTNNKKSQYRKITSEIHDKTITIMMNASKELAVREKLQNEPSMELDSEDSSMDQTLVDHLGNTSNGYNDKGSWNQSQSEIGRGGYTQKPYW